MDNIRFSLNVALILQGLGALFDLIGYAAPYWHDERYVTNHIYYGLWKRCVEKGPFRTVIVEVCTSLISGDHEHGK